MLQFSLYVSGHVNVLKWLNAKGDISSTDTLGGSPLHDAAENGQFEVSCENGYTSLTHDSSLF